MLQIRLDFYSPVMKVKFPMEDQDAVQNYPTHYQFDRGGSWKAGRV